MTGFVTFEEIELAFGDLAGFEGLFAVDFEVGARVDVMIELEIVLGETSGKDGVGEEEVED